MAPSSRPSSPPLLPTSLATLPSTRGALPRYVRILLVLTFLLVGARSIIKPHRQRITTLILKRSLHVPCEALGMVTPFDDETQEQHRVAIRVRATNPPELEGDAPGNSTILHDVFHPHLASLQTTFFPDTPSEPINRTTSFDSTSECISPISHVLPHLPSPPQPSSEPSLFFAMCTTPKRILAQFVPIWSHFLRPRERRIGSWFEGAKGAEMIKKGPGCLIVHAAEERDREGMDQVNEILRESETECRMIESSRPHERYEMKVLRLIRDSWVESERRRWQFGTPATEWFVIGDDDTFWVDPKLLHSELAKYNYKEDHLLASFSEAQGNYDTFGRIAFGGGGMLISRGLARKMQGLLETCATKFADVFGGDGLISNCAALAKNVPLEEVVEELPGLSQMDMRGDATGFLTTGRKTFLTIHHWAGWLDLIPGQAGADTIRLFQQTIDAVGGQNFLRRFVFDGGKTTFTLGHSIIVHKEALTEEDLTKVEHTWIDHPPRVPSRPVKTEGTEKLTYYLTSVVPLSPTLTVFRHTTNSTLTHAPIREIDVIWDSADTVPHQDWWWPSNVGQRIAGMEDAKLSHQDTKGQSLRHAKW